MGRPIEYLPLIIYLLMYTYKHVFMLFATMRNFEWCLLQYTTIFIYISVVFMSFIFAELQGVRAILIAYLLLIYIY